MENQSITAYDLDQTLSSNYGKVLIRNQSSFSPCLKGRLGTAKNIRGIMSRHQKFKRKKKGKRLYCGEKRGKEK